MEVLSEDHLQTFTGLNTKKKTLFSDNKEVSANVVLALQFVCLFGWVRQNSYGFLPTDLIKTYRDQLVRELG